MLLQPEKKSAEKEKGEKERKGIFRNSGGSIAKKS